MRSWIHKLPTGGSPLKTTPSARLICYNVGIINERRIGRAALTRQEFDSEKTNLVGPTIWQNYDVFRNKILQGCKLASIKWVLKKRESFQKPETVMKNWKEKLSFSHTFVKLISQISYPWRNESKARNDPNPHPILRKEQIGIEKGRKKDLIQVSLRSGSPGTRKSFPNPVARAVSDSIEFTLIQPF